MPGTLLCRWLPLPTLQLANQPPGPGRGWGSGAESHLPSVHPCSLLICYFMAVAHSHGAPYLTIHFPVYKARRLDGFVIFFFLKQDSFGTKEFPEWPRGSLGCTSHGSAGLVETGFLASLPLPPGPLNPHLSLKPSGHHLETSQ